MSAIAGLGPVVEIRNRSRRRRVDNSEHGRCESLSGTRRVRGPSTRARAVRIHRDPQRPRMTPCHPRYPVAPARSIIPPRYTNTAESRVSRLGPTGRLHPFSASGSMSKRTPAPRIIVADSASMSIHRSARSRPPQSTTVAATVATSSWRHPASGLWACSPDDIGLNRALRVELVIGAADADDLGVDTQPEGPSWARCRTRVTGIRRRSSRIACGCITGSAELP